MTNGEKSVPGRNPDTILTYSPDGDQGPAFEDRIQYAVTGVLNFEGSPVTRVVAADGAKNAERAFRKLFSHVPVTISECARC